MLAVFVSQGYSWLINWKGRSIWVTLGGGGIKREGDGWRWEGRKKRDEGSGRSIAKIRTATKMFAS